MVHERLAIVGIDSGVQPLLTADGNVILCVNGEIYNHKSLEKGLDKKYSFLTKSDCEVILYLYLEHGPDFVSMLDGMFSFVLYDKTRDFFMAARDHVGITTLYYGEALDKSVWFASEMKCLNEDCKTIVAFPPGHVYTSDVGKLKEYYHPRWFDTVTQANYADGGKQTFEQDTDMYAAIRDTLTRSVRKRLMCETPYGVLLSGGLDSSLIASIAVDQVRLMRQGADTRLTEDDEGVAELASQWPTVHSFAIGLENSPDLAAAAVVAKFLGTKHHNFTFTVQEGIDALSEVILHLETYDVTTVRASTPMYLLSRKIKASGVKMVLSGEGSDEIFGGYLYFHQAPSAQALHQECVSRIQNLHTADCLRANKSTMAWGVEARVPFLDKAFLDVAMEVVPASHKLVNKAPYFHKMEKHVLRQAFSVPKSDGKPYLPNEILWRQKEQFSDGVGYSWINGIKDYAEQRISDLQLAEANARWTRDVPATKEAYLYRLLFDEHFPQPACVDSVVRWIPRKDWGCSEDPSGRAQKSHVAAYSEQASGSPEKKRLKTDSASPESSPSTRVESFS